MVDFGKTFGNLVDTVKGYSTDRLVQEVRSLENMLDNDDVANSVLIDIVISLYDIARDECVERLAKSVSM